MRETRRNTQTEGGQHRPCLVTHRVSWRTLDALLSLRSGRALPKEAMRSWRGQEVKYAIKVTESELSQGLGMRGWVGCLSWRDSVKFSCVCAGGAVTAAGGHSLWLLWLLWGQQVPVK